MAEFHHFCAAEVTESCSHPTTSASRPRKGPSYARIGRVLELSLKSIGSQGLICLPTPTFMASCTSCSPVTEEVVRSLTILINSITNLDGSRRSLFLKATAETVVS